MRLGIGGEQRPTLMLSARSRKSLRLTPETVVTCCEALIIDRSNHPWLTTAQCLKRPIGLFLDASSPQGEAILKAALRKTRIDAVVCQISSQRTCKELELQHFSTIAAITHDQRLPLVARFQDVPACLQQTRFLCRIANDYGAVGVITKYDERTVETVLQHASGTVTVETPYPECEHELLALASQLKDIGVHGLDLSESLAIVQHPDAVLTALHSMIRWRLSIRDTWDLAQAVLLEAY
jgi:uncharacterized protein YjiS (DUF1127 family)